MDYKEKLTTLLEENMTEKGFKLWQGINQRLPDIWEKPTSSTGKWHRKANGRVPSCAEHTYEMLYAAVKVYRLFKINPKTQDADKLLFAIALHDSLKYGQFGNRPHTDTQHDKNAADMIKGNKDTFLKILNEDQYQEMEEAVRFHSGQWSTQVSNIDAFTWDDYKPYTLFVHMLDMMSTADIIQTDVRE